MLSWKIGPTLACGNTIMLKTAEQTPLSAFYVANLLQETGLSEGILNIISGFATTADAPLRSHMDMDKVLNAGKNKLKSMDEVGGLVNLRALILNGEYLQILDNASWLEALPPLKQDTIPCVSFQKILTRNYSV